MHFYINKTLSPGTMNIHIYSIKKEKFNNTIFIVSGFPFAVFIT